MRGLVIVGTRTGLVLLSTSVYLISAGLVIGSGLLVPAPARLGIFQKALVLVYLVGPEVALLMERTSLGALGVRRPLNGSPGNVSVRTS